MLVMLKRDFYGSDGQLYAKSLNRTPTPVPNALKKQLPADAEIVSHEMLETPDPVYKKGSLIMALQGKQSPVETLQAADADRVNADALAAAHETADTVLAEKRAKFERDLAAEKKSGAKK